MTSTSVHKSAAVNLPYSIGHLVAFDILCQVPRNARGYCFFKVPIVL